MKNAAWEKARLPQLKHLSFTRRLVTQKTKALQVTKAAVSGMIVGVELGNRAE
jgi:hypothetical protein